VNQPPVPASPGATVLNRAGTFDVTCIGSPDPLCGTDGVVALSGTLDTGTDVIGLATTTNPNALVGTFSGAPVWTGTLTSLHGEPFSWTLTSVPEPATMALLPLGLAAPA
jgi:hypothetical protein